MARGAEIDRRDALSYGEFESEYLTPNKPVIVTDALAHWQALGKWTPEWLAEQFPDRMLEFKYGDLSLSLGEFIPKVMDSSPESPAPYLTNLPLSDNFPELVDDVMPAPTYFGPNWARRKFLHGGVRQSLNRGSEMEIYIGGPGGAFPILHWDGMATHAYLMQVYGVKQYWVWPPEDSDYLYPSDGGNTSPIRNVEDPDFDKYPLFEKARATTFTLHPGELLFVPSCWWHTAKMLTPSITLSVNTLNRSNWKNFAYDIKRKAHGPALVAKSIYLMSELCRFGIMDSIGL